MLLELLLMYTLAKGMRWQTYKNLDFGVMAVLTSEGRKAVQALENE